MMHNAEHLMSTERDLHNRPLTVRSERAVFRAACFLLLAMTVVITTGCQRPATYIDFNGRFVEHKSPVDVSLRGLCVVDAECAWASGAGGTVLRTTDGGRHWENVDIADAHELDFRDVHAFSEHEAIVVSAGQPAHFYRTDDGGQNWEKVYDDPHETSFFDAASFWDDSRGIAFSDPVDGFLHTVVTMDGGRNWNAQQRSLELHEAEAGFAASGTGMTTFGAQRAWIGLGGATDFGGARIAMTLDRGERWHISDTPMRTSESSGVFSLTFFNQLHGIAVGGDYQNPDSNDHVALLTRDGGRTWTLINDDPPAGYRSCVAIQPGDPSLYGFPPLIAVGTNGCDFSLDGGVRWQQFSEVGFHAVAFDEEGNGWAVGAGGTIARWQPSD